MQQLTIKHVDAFTAEPFSGNPAGVIDGRNGLLDQLMVPIENKETILDMHPDMIKLSLLNKKFGIERLPYTQCS